MVKMWNDRLMWSGETPLNYPGLNPVAGFRCDVDEIRPVGEWSDIVNQSRVWKVLGQLGAHGRLPGIWGPKMALNTSDPATQQTRISLANFAGMWPSSGKLLLGLWMRQSYTMAFNPLMSSRGGPGQPLAYISTNTAGRFRHTVYDASGGTVLDQYEDAPFGVGTYTWFWVGQLLDMTAKTSQMAIVHQEGQGRLHLGPVRSFTGTPNAASVADLDIFSLQSAGYWTGGEMDEVMLAHPSSSFDFAAYAERIRSGVVSDGARQLEVAGRFTVTDAGITANGAQVLKTGAEAVSWVRRPFHDAPAGSVPYWSTNGTTWSTGAQLPEPFTGLLRWEVSLTSGSTFTGININEPTLTPPTLAPIPDVVMEQNDTVTVPLVYTVDGPGTWTIVQPSYATVERQGDSLVLNAGFAMGTGLCTVTLRDADGQTATRTFSVQVVPATVTPTPPPIYPFASIIVWDDDEPSRVVAEPLYGVITEEVDGEETFTFEIHADAPEAELIENERRVTVAGEVYTIRRVTDSHIGGRLTKRVYCEARFYELATAKQVDAREWTQVLAGDAMRVALEGTGWTVGVANVGTLRTYETEDTNPLALLRTIRSQHGGSLVFDNANRRVSLLTSTGRDNGVTFFYGFGLREAARVVDTTSLVTRIYAKNADGQTIAPVNGGLDYVQDLSYTSAIKSATYNFASGVSPATMLAMTTATLANRAYPDYSYEVKVVDLSVDSGAAIDRFALRDFVRVVDEAIDLNELQRVVHMEYDVVSPWNSVLTLSGKLREGRNSEDGLDSGVLDTGARQSTFDLVPYNLLLNGRFDNDLNHWARFGVTVEDVDQGTSDYAAIFEGPGERWIEQTVAVDNRDAFALSLDIEFSGGPIGWTPNLVAEATITFEDGSTDVIPITLT